MQRQRMFNHKDLLVFIINDLKDTEIFKLSFKVPTLPTWYSTNITKVYREIVRISCIRILNGHSHHMIIIQLHNPRYNTISQNKNKN